jgi:hypothetical protein
MSSEVTKCSLCRADPGLTISVSNKCTRGRVSRLLWKVEAAIRLKILLAAQQVEDSSPSANSAKTM